MSDENEFIPFTLEPKEVTIFPLNGSKFITNGSFSQTIHLNNSFYDAESKKWILMDEDGVLRILDPVTNETSEIDVNSR